MTYQWYVQHGADLYRRGIIDVTQKQGYDRQIETLRSLGLLQPERSITAGLSGSGMLKERPEEGEKIWENERE